MSRYYHWHPVLCSKHCQPGQSSGSKLRRASENNRKCLFIFNSVPVRGWAFHPPANQCVGSLLRSLRPSLLERMRPSIQWQALALDYRDASIFHFVEDTETCV